MASLMQEITDLQNQLAQRDETLLKIYSEAVYRMNAEDRPTGLLHFAETIARIIEESSCLTLPKPS